MKHFISLTLILIFLSYVSKAQDFEYGKITPSDLSIKDTKIDSNANAVVIREFGTAMINYETGDYFVDYYYHVKIKILNKNGFVKGNVEIPLAIYADLDDEVKELKATTFNTTNGSTSRSELNKSNVFTENVNKYYKVMKFTLPNLVEGSIIEYSYKIAIPRINNFKGWDFQSDIPKIHTEFIARIPAMFEYNASLRGGRKLTSQTNVVERQCFLLGGGVDCSKITYVMKDVPPLIEEDYMTSAKNYRAAIHYELAVYITPTGEKVNLRKEWRDIEKQLNDDKTFGAQLKRQDVFKNIIPDIIANSTDEISKAKAIYHYISKNIKTNGFYGFFSMSNIKNALERHSGNVGDINLALICALRSAGLDAEALILSTRDNGTVNELFPVMNDYNYVVAKLNIGNEVYLLDSSDPQLPFGLIPLHCVNGKGRVINSKKASYWYDVKANQKQSTVYQLIGEISSDGKLQGNLIIYTLGYDALRKRKEILSATSIEDYVEKLDERMTNFNILNHKIENIDSLDNALTESYEISMKMFENDKINQLFLNPYFVTRTAKNPFNLNERSYPVNFGVLSSEKVIMRIKLPEDFTLAEKPKNTAISMEENGGKYTSAMTYEDNTLNFNQSLQIGRTVYLPEEYLGLKDFFNHIIQSQKSDLIFKKVK